ncbi:MAG: hypothetical protein ACK4Y4_07915 [Brevundimonas sp.]
MRSRLIVSGKQIMSPLPPATAASAVRPEFTSPEIEAAKADPKLPEKVSRFQALASTVLDTSGKFSEAERVQAYVSAVEMAVTGQMKGMGNAGLDLFAEVNRSDIVQKSLQLQRDMSAAVMPISMTGDGPGSARAALAFYDGLSSSDQSLLFQLSINAPQRDGKRFTSVQGWRDNMNAVIQLGEYTQANRDLINSGATSKADDPKFAAALKLGRANDIGSATWSSMVLKLFEAPRDRIDLSEDARRRVGEPSDTIRPESRYQEGALASKRV